jgi:hypothetical protein
MRRDLEDLHTVRPEHLDIHDALENWARWADSSRRSVGVLPMFRYYRPDNWERTVRSHSPIDVKAALGIQTAFIGLPEKNRHAINWAYLYYFIHPRKVCKALAVSDSGLAGLIHDGRTMLRNRAI